MILKDRKRQLTKFTAILKINPVYLCKGHTWGNEDRTESGSNSLKENQRKGLKTKKNESTLADNVASVK